MFRALLILSICICAARGMAQTIPVPGNVLQTARQKLDNKKDSATGLSHTYVNARPATTKKTTASDSIPAKKSTPGLAPTDTQPPAEILVPSLDRTACKRVVLIPETAPFDDVKARPEPTRPHPTAEKPHVPFLQVHGNVLYNLNYYSRIDTPFSEQNIYQHTIQTWLDILVKGQYPMRIYLTNHFSNSPLFRNFSDFNFGYNNSSFEQQIREKLRNQFLQSLPSEKMLDSLQRLINSDWDKLHGLSSWMKNPALIQRMVEERELSLRKPSSKTDSSTTDTSALKDLEKDRDIMDSLYAVRRKEADSLQKEITRIQALLESTHVRSGGEVNQGLQDLQRLDNPAALQKKMQELGMSDSALPKGYKTLMAVKSFNIGRTMVNYSELSAKNISINGVQVEYNPSWYYAVASGSVDYRFRDFVIQQPNEPHQYMNIFRIGHGLKNGNNVILTYFTGRRQLYNASTSDTGNTQVPSSSLMGLTLEGNYHITRNILFTGEVAKSSMPYYAGDSSKKSMTGSLFSMGNHSNEAWSTKIDAFFPSTQTRVRADYKRLSMNYQSFSIFTDGSAQSAWGVHLDQLFFRKQLDIALGANTNDFSNPLIGAEFKSTTVFKSIQATLRKRYWPVISLGYFPSSQLTKMGNGQYMENLFYTMVGNLTHSYTYHGLMMNTALVYTQFYNRSSDSGFTYFNTRNLLLSQTLFLGKFTFQLNASAASNDDYQLYMLEGKIQRTFGSSLTLGGGVKYNKQTVYNIGQMGYSAEASWRIPHFGQIQFSADKGFIPGMNNRLVSDNTGRLTYFKSF